MTDLQHQKCDISHSKERRLRLRFGLRLAAQQIFYHTVCY